MTGCASAQPVPVERMAAFVDSTGSFHQGDRVPLVISADRGQHGVSFEQECRPRSSQLVFSDDGSLSIPFAHAPGLYHEVAMDPAGDVLEAPVIVRSGFPLDRPQPETAL